MHCSEYYFLSIIYIILSMKYFTIIDVNTNEAGRENPITYEHNSYKIYSFLTEVKVLPRCVVNPNNCQGIVESSFQGVRDVEEPPGAKVEKSE